MATLRLDEEQQRAAAAPEQRVRVLAGAGTGKTTTLVARARYLLGQGLRPQQLCIVTFTRKAAEELGRRIGPQGTGVVVGTIHSLGLRILRYERLGRPVADNRKQKQLILQALRDCGSKEPLAKVAAQVRRAKSFGSPYPLTIRAIGHRYEKLLDEYNLYDFDDLILRPRLLLLENELAGIKWATRFQHLLIDEAQDTSTVQWEMLECLTTPATNSYVVGDIGQSIYSWRGAEAEGMLARFSENVATYTIGKNYRSRQPILQVANRVLEGQSGAVTLELAREVATDPGVLAVYGTSVIDAVGGVLRGLGLQDGGPWNPTDVCVLARTHAVLGEVELACTAANIPYFLVGGLSFYERNEVLDILAHLEYAAGVDVPNALERIHNRPSRYLGAAWLAAVHAQGGWQQWERGGPQHLHWPHDYMARRAWELWDVCVRLRQFGSAAPAVAVVDYVLKEVGYAAWVRKDGVADAEQSEDNDVLDNLAVLREAASQRGTVAEFIAFADACRHRPQRVQGAGGVTLSTIHRAKGLEWPVVIVAGCEEGTLPHGKGNPNGEERRLYYVAVTRPMERLILAGSGTPSRYLRESCAVLGLVVPGLPPEGGSDGADVDASGTEGDADCGTAGEGNGDRTGAPDGGADRGDGPDGAGAGPGSTGDG